MPFTRHNAGRFATQQYVVTHRMRTVSRQLVYGHFVYDTSSTDISSTDISSTMTFVAEIEAGVMKRKLCQINARNSSYLEVGLMKISVFNWKNKLDCHDAMLANCICCIIIVSVEAGLIKRFIV